MSLVQTHAGHTRDALRRVLDSMLAALLVRAKGRDVLRHVLDVLRRVLALKAKVELGPAWNLALLDVWRHKNGAADRSFGCASTLY